MARTNTRVAVIGAGAAGLCAAKRLLEKGVDVVVFELGSSVGGLWVYNNDNGRSPAYASLHINSEAAVTGYPDFPFSDGTTLFPSHRQVRSYLDAYADRFGIRERIRFRTPVTGVAPSAARPDGGWEVTAGGTSERFDAVVVASGHQAVPAHPSFRERFDGAYLHAHAYRTPQPFEGKRVLVVGVGNSGLDIAADVCTVAKSTAIAVRSPVLIMPRMLFGVPTARILGRLRKAPWPVQRRAQRLASWIAYGPMERYGLTPPELPTHPASATTFMTHVAYDRIRIRPGITEVDGRAVRFADGRREEYDTMVAATGYEIDLPFLDDGLAPVEGRELLAYRRVVHPDAPGLYFVGFFNVSGGANIRMMDVQAQWLAELVAGEAGLPGPEAMRAEIARERREVARRYPATPRYGLELDPVRYPRQIALERERSA